MIFGRRWATRTVVFRGIGVLLLKIGVVGGVLGWLIGQHTLPLPPVEARQVAPLAGWALLSCCLGLGINARQLQLLLVPQAIRLSYGQVVGVQLASALIGKVAPGVGNEAVKIFLLCRKTSAGVAHALAGLAADHALAALGKATCGVLLLVAALGLRLVSLPVGWAYAQALARSVAGKIPWTTAVAGLLLGVLLAIVVIRRFYPRLARLGRRFLAAVLRYRATPRLLLTCLLLSFVIPLISVSYLLLGFRVLEVHAPWTFTTLVSTGVLIIAFRRVLLFFIHLIGGGLSLLLLDIHPSERATAHPPLIALAQTPDVQEGI